MLNNTHTKQIILIVTMMAVVGFLFTRDVKGLAKPEEKTQTASQTEMSNPQLSIEEASITGKNLIASSLVKEITFLEGKYKNAFDQKKIPIAKELAQKWDDVEQAVPSALYLEIIANQEPNLNNWLAAGTRFLKAFDTTQDSLVSPIMLQKANHAFIEAMDLDSANIEAKTGLGITIVNGMGAPMSGIAMLLDVVKKEPKNLKANMNLGIFAIKSGQFGKAIIRFKDIIDNIKASPDAYFYLATAYENLGQNTEAIDAYLNSKKLAANPTLSSFIDKKVAELKNKR